MNSVRKFTALLLAVLMVLSLSGCSFLAKERTAQEDREALIRILDDLSANMHPGTAGSSLTSARLAADLIGWATTTKMDKSEAAAIVMEWLKEQSPEIRAAFREKINSVADTYGTIIRDSAADLLKAAGVEKDLSNLGSRMQEIVEEILATGGLD